MDVPGRPAQLGWIALLLIAASLSGCASAPARPAGKPTADPWERMNRSIYRFNDAVDRAAVKPVAKTYRKITPDWMRKGIGNFFTNLDQPTVIINDLLQGKPKSALNDTGRLIINTVFGLGGLFDPASGSNIALNDEDFGQTLAVWGVPSGPFLMLPFLGPSTLRDGSAKVGDYYTGPLTYADLRTAVKIGLRGLDVIDQRARLLANEGALEQTYDKYAFIRSVWLQRRQFLIRDGEVPPDDEPEDEEEESADDKPKQPMDESRK